MELVTFLQEYCQFLQEDNFLWRLVTHVSCIGKYITQTEEKIPIFHKNHYLQGKKTHSKMDSKYRKNS